MLKTIRITCINSIGSKSLLAAMMSTAQLDHLTTTSHLSWVERPSGFHLQRKCWLAYFPSFILIQYLEPLGISSMSRLTAPMLNVSHSPNTIYDYWNLQLRKHEWLKLTNPGESVLLYSAITSHVLNTNSQMGLNRSADKLAKIWSAVKGKSHDTRLN